MTDTTVGTEFTGPAGTTHPFEYDGITMCDDPHTATGQAIDLSFDPESERRISKVWRRVGVRPHVSPAVFIQPAGG